MRFGDIVLLLLMTLIGFGFLLSHSINLNDELTQSRSQLARIQAELEMLEGQRQAFVEEKGRLTEQVSGLNNANALLLAQVEALQAERLALSVQVEALQKKLALVEAGNAFLAWMVSAPAGRVAALLIVPMVPLSLSAVYIMTHPRATNLPPIPTNGSGHGQTTIQATLTREEFHLVALRRRSRAASKQIRCLGNTQLG